MGIVERRREQVQEFASSYLESGEQIVAALPNGLTGWPYLGVLNLLWVRCFAVAVTDRRVLFVRCSVSAGNPQSLEASVPRDSVRVLQWQTGLWSKLVITRPDRPDPFKLNVTRTYRTDGDEVVTALRTSARSDRRSPTS
jgi:hypothetical protein